MDELKQQTQLLSLEMLQQKVQKQTFPVRILISARVGHY